MKATYKFVILTGLFSKLISLCFQLLKLHSIESDDKIISQLESLKPIQTESDVRGSELERMWKEKFLA
jgi:hypothetical protein